MTIPGSVRILFTEAIDYAGLFPPATLSLEETVRSYAAYRSGPHAWALGRLVVPAARLPELQTLIRSIDPGGRWPVSVLAGDDLNGGRPGPHLDVTSVEVRFTGHGEPSKGAKPSRDTHDALAHIRESFDSPVYVELPLSPDPRPLIRALAETGLRAKARTGGITPEAIPSGRDVLAFLAACLASGVPFKVTAGLHHAVRGSYPLTYEPGSACAMMHGFVNVFVATALLAEGTETSPLESLLDETDPGAFTFEDDAVAWRDRRAGFAGLAATRQYLTGFGSCSFEEPVEALQTLGLSSAEAQ